VVAEPAENKPASEQKDPAVAQAPQAKIETSETSRTETNNKLEEAEPAAETTDKPKQKKKRKPPGKKTGKPAKKAAIPARKKSGSSAAGKSKGKTLSKPEGSAGRKQA